MYHVHTFERDRLTFHAKKKRGKMGTRVRPPYFSVALQGWPFYCGIANSIRVQVQPDRTPNGTALLKGGKHGSCACLRVWMVLSWRLLTIITAIRAWALMSVDVSAPPSYCKAMRAVQGQQGQGIGIDDGEREGSQNSQEFHTRH